MIQAAAQPTGVTSALQAAVLGIVQGLTEFLPISSTAHLRIVPAFVGWPDPGAAFTAVIQLGTTAAVLLYFWRELVQIIVGWCRGLLDRSACGTLESRYGWYLIVATVPVAVFGLVFSDQIERGARNLWVISVTLIVLALVLALAERVGRRKRGERDLDGLGYTGIGVLLAFVVGLASIAWLMRYLARHSTYLFIWYRIGLGGGLLALLSTGVLEATG